MEKDNKVLISAILIIGIAIFASLLTSNISGKAISKRDCSPAWASVTPKEGIAGTIFTISFDSEPERQVNYNGINGPIYIISKNDGRRVESFNKLYGDCSGNDCDSGTIAVKTMSQETGGTKWFSGETYCPTAIDSCLQDRIEYTGGCFKIR